MHGTQAHVLIDGRMACTGDEEVFFDIIQKNGFKCASSLSVIPSYFRNGATPAPRRSVTPVGVCPRADA